MASNCENKRAVASNYETGLFISRSFILINNDDDGNMCKELRALLNSSKIPIAQLHRLFSYEL